MKYRKYSAIIPLSQNEQNILGIENSQILVSGL